MYQGHITCDLQLIPDHLAHFTCHLSLIMNVLSYIFFKIEKLNVESVTRLLHHSDTLLSCYESLHEIVIQSISKLAQNMDSALLPCVIAFLPLGCQVVNFVHQLSVSWCQSPTLYLSLITVSKNVTWHHQLLPHTLPDTITSFRTLYLTLSSLSPHFN